MKAKGLYHQIKNNKKEYPTLHLKEIEKFLMDIVKNRPKDDFGLSEFPPRKLTWQEANSLCEISQEEYENSTGLYQIGRSITGIGGWNLFMKELRNKAHSHLKDLP